MAAKHANDRLQGTLDLMILKVLAGIESAHGYALAQRIHELSSDRLRIEEGSLYPALHRMTNAKWLKAQWGVTDTNRKARFYSLTAVGHRQLEEEQTRWLDLTKAVAQVLKLA